jgi:hypothetical protein
MVDPLDLDPPRKSPAATRPARFSRRKPDETPDSSSDSFKRQAD